MTNHHAVAPPQDLHVCFERVIVCLILASQPYDEHWPYEVAQRAEINPGTAWHVLCRLRQAGWLSERRESKQDSRSGMPRRLFRTTADGIVALRHVYHLAQGDARYRPWIPERAPTLSDGSMPSHDHLIADEQFWNVLKAPTTGPAPTAKRGRCRKCGTVHVLREDGTVWHHGGSRPRDWCTGSWEFPSTDRPDREPM